MLRDLRVAVSNASHSLHHSGLMRPLHSAALGAGNQWIRHRSASKNGAMLQDAGRTRAFLITRRNLVPFGERADGTRDFIGKPGRALSGNPSVAALRQPPNDLDFPTLHTSLFRTHVVISNFCTTNERNTWCTKNAC